MENQDKVVEIFVHAAVLGYLHGLADAPPEEIKQELCTMIPKSLASQKEIVNLFDAILSVWMKQ